LKRLKGPKKLKGLKKLKGVAQLLRAVPSRFSRTLVSATCRVGAWLGGAEGLGVRVGYGDS
jgi:hypothetical protein